MPKYLKYWECPKGLREKLDGSDFLVGIYRKKIDSNTYYVAEFGGTFEKWYRIYDGRGVLIKESSFLPKEVE